MKTAVLGAGAWGTTLANMLAHKGTEVSLWVREPELVEEMRQAGENTWFLPGVGLHPGLAFDADMARVLSGADIVLLVVPSQFLRSVLSACKAHLQRRSRLVCASKGIELENLKTMSQVVHEEAGDLSPCFAMLSGPSFAREVSQGLPTAVTLGCGDRERGQELQEALSTQTFRVYYSPDVNGVELGGALKNVIAIAAGITDGLGVGNNARASLITRGLAEMSRLGVAMGADQKTFMGLSGLGDLVLTCTGDLSRNRQVGMRIGRGEKLAEILGNTRTVAEGVKTADSVRRLADALGVEMPITGQVHQMLYEDKDPEAAVQELMGRELKTE
jgi:glycerol-3-phosphate dehydrogenase (NAD(P)+)